MGVTGCRKLTFSKHNRPEAAASEGGQQQKGEVPLSGEDAAGLRPGEREN